MLRTRYLVLSLAVFAFFSGCGVQDPEQPAVGSISINARGENDDKPLVNKKTSKPFRNPK